MEAEIGKTRDRFSRDAASPELLASASNPVSRCGDAAVHHASEAGAALIENGLIIR